MTLGHYIVAALASRLLQPVLCAMSQVWKIPAECHATYLERLAQSGSISRWLQAMNCQIPKLFAVTSLASHKETGMLECTVAVRGGEAKVVCMCGCEQAREREKNEC